MTAYELYRGHDSCDDEENGDERSEDGNDKGDLLLDMPEKVDDTGKE